MPTKDGLSATNEIREYIYLHGKVQPIIIGVTGSLDSKYLKLAIKAGMNMVLQKPINGSKLKPILEKL